MASERARLLLIEDHPIVRLGLTTVMNAQEDMEIVGEVERASDALGAITRLEPDLVILPLRLEGESAGLDLCRDIKMLDPSPRVLMYTSFTSANDASMAFLSGADSYLTKDSPEQSLLRTIRETLAGGRVWINGAVAERSAAALQSGVEGADLTAREREVLGFMLQRYTNDEICGELFISIPTVKTHVSNVLRKLGFRNRRDLLSGDSA